MKAIEHSCTFEASASDIADAIDAFVVNEKKTTCSWSGDRKKAALLIEQPVWWSEHLRGKSVVLNIRNDGVVDGECSDLALFMLSRQSDIDMLHRIFTGIRDNLN